MEPLLARPHRSVQSPPCPAPAWPWDVSPGSGPPPGHPMALGIHREDRPLAPFRKGFFRGGPRRRRDGRTAGQEDVPEGSSPRAAAGALRRGRLVPWICPRSQGAVGQLPALQVLGDQVGFIVLRQVVAPHEAFLALRALKSLVTCGGRAAAVRGWQPACGGPGTDPFLSLHSPKPATAR